jgi:hypothetical protein
LADAWARARYPLSIRSVPAGGPAGGSLRGWGGRLASPTTFRPCTPQSLDGARYLLRLGWPVRVCALVAHHSAARFVAEQLGLGEELRAFPDEASAVSDALVYADQTTGPDGARQPMLARITDSVVRHGPDSPQALVHAERLPCLLAAGHRVERRLRALVAFPRR